MNKSHIDTCEIAQAYFNINISSDSWAVWRFKLMLWLTKKRPSEITCYSHRYRHQYVFISSDIHWVNIIIIIKSSSLLPTSFFQLLFGLLLVTSWSLVEMFLVLIFILSWYQGRGSLKHRWCFTSHRTGKRPCLRIHNRTANVMTVMSNFYTLWYNHQSKLGSLRVIK